MSSLGTSLCCTCSPKDLSKHDSRLHRDLNTSQVSSIKISSLPNNKSSPQVNGKPSSLTRRESIGFGFGVGVGVGLLDVLFQLQATAAIEGGASCELTVASSGLAFCDKLVGTGPEAVKGQLIKVNYSILSKIFVSIRDSFELSWCTNRFRVFLH